jgi:hypothetical protein
VTYEAKDEAGRGRMSVYKSKYGMENPEEKKNKISRAIQETKEEA